MALFDARMPDVEELPAPQRGAQLLDARPLEDYLQPPGGRRQLPVCGSSFATKAAFVLEPERRSLVAATDEAEARRAIRGLRSVAVLDVPGFVLGGGSETTAPVELGELEALIASGAEVLDVREKDERDGGYIPGSRNIPYRLLPMAGKT